MEDHLSSNVQTGIFDLSRIPVAWETVDSAQLRRNLEALESSTARQIKELNVRKRVADSRKRRDQDERLKRDELAAAAGSGSVPCTD